MELFVWECLLSYYVLLLASVGLVCVSRKVCSNFDDGRIFLMNQAKQTVLALKVPKLHVLNHFLEALPEKPNSGDPLSSKFAHLRMWDVGRPILQVCTSEDEGCWETYSVVGLKFLQLPVRMLVPQV
ncbi:hypothetical protein SAY86_004931 [Trapa natans]|uniref:Uncharacterized protein n=1 Tax=Trapa natans TaxID=22666 RepID=A0AAN7RFX4_TRANT|nr:hypothetical protein SAY86_004931 [Trapa natans]